MTINNASITQPHDIIRNMNETVSPKRKKLRKFSASDAFLLYNGGCEEYEDPADYIRMCRGISGTVIA